MQDGEKTWGVEIELDLASYTSTRFKLVGVIDAQKTVCRPLLLTVPL